MSDTFNAIERVADAILYEGYVLYPYRTSAAQNQLRWQFGVVAPQPPQEYAGEPWFSQTECLIEARPTRSAAAVRMSVRIRCLRPRPVERDDQTRQWLEGLPHAIDLDDISLSALPLAQDVRLDLDGVDAHIIVAAKAIDRFIKVRLRLENLEAWRPEFDGDRDAMLQHSFVGAHLLMSVDGGAFVSLLEPPESAAAAVARCANAHTWPVLVGHRGARNQMLSSPIVLDDYPAVANESHGDLCDAAEIDEVLRLRSMTLTED